MRAEISLYAKLKLTLYALQHFWNGKSGRIAGCLWAANKN